MLPGKIRKRDNSIVLFEPEKIEKAVYNACFNATSDPEKAAGISRDITETVLEKISSRYAKDIPSIEDVQDIVEDSLIRAGYPDIAKGYILYRKEHSDIRQTKTVLGIKDDLKLPLNSVLVLKKRYLLKDRENRISETPRELFHRVARAVSRAELNFSTKRDRSGIQDSFFKIMTGLEFLPNSPTLMNAGTAMGQLSACFVLPVSDSLEEIFETVKHTALIHRTGGGTGFDFSNLRARGEMVSTTGGKASGPVSFMSIFDQTTSVIMQGGKRRGANMGIMRCDHPDIFEFVEAKLKDGEFSNFNLSVAVTDSFMDAVRKNSCFDLIAPSSGKKVRRIKAKALFDLISFTAWRTGDPGLIFIDEINRKNPTPEIGKISATNPCSEVLLLPYESCNLGSINLARMVKNGSIDWNKIRKTVHLGIRFLDNVIEVNKYPLPQIKKISLANRKIGLGVMGFADMLIMLGIGYNSPKAAELASRLMAFIHDCSLQASSTLAEQRGPFPNIDHSIYKRKNIILRNATLNAIAPTGTISIIAGCSSGIEPLFSLSYTRNIMGGTKMFEINPLFESELEKMGMDSRQIMAHANMSGTISNIKEIPERLKKIFVTSFDIPPLKHLAIQAAFQKHTDNSVSKTINLPQDATADDVRKIYLAAYNIGCKGITIYRYGSKENQVLSLGTYSRPEYEELPEPEESPECRSGRCNI